ncbi:MAG: hypothetical protein RL091_920 [Verrucomicrobiota bacterium]
MLKHLQDFFYAVAGPVVRVLNQKPSNVRHILLAAEQSLTAEYLAEFWEITRGDQRLRFFVTLQDCEQSPGDHARILARLPVTQVSRRTANLRKWDLVVLANHPGYFKRLADPAQQPVLRIPHGVSGKSYKGVNYHYDPKYLYTPEGQPHYTCILESSHVSRRAAIERDPRLRDQIVVVGNSRLDKISATMLERDSLRSSLGLASPRPVVLMASSWGPNCLFTRIGDELFQQAQRLLNDYEIVLRPHPHLYNRNISQGKDWTATFDRLVALGFRVSPPDQSLAAIMASSDVAVVDDLTSVAIYAAATGMKTVLVRSNPSGANQAGAQMGESTFADRLGQIVPTIDTAAELGTALQKACLSWPPPGLKSIQAEINGEPGRSADLIRREVCRLLRLEEPSMT